MAVVEEMVNLVRDYLDNDGWNYEYDDARKIIRTGVNLKCKLQNSRLYISFSNDGFTVLATVSMKADAQYIQSIVEYLTRANFGLRSGSFEVDYRDGEIRYRVYTNYKGMNTISKEIIEDSIMIPPLMFERYGDGLAALMFGFSDPVTEIEKAEKR